MFCGLSRAAFKANFAMRFLFSYYPFGCSEIGGCFIAGKSSIASFLSPRDGKRSGITGRPGLMLFPAFLSQEEQGRKRLYGW